MKKVLGSIILSALLIMGGVPTHAASQKASTISLTILFKNNEIPTDFKNQLLKQNAEIISELPKLGALEIKGSADLIPAIQADTRVQAVSPVMKMTLSDKQVTMDKVKAAGGTDPSRIGPPHPGDNHYLFDTMQWDIKRVTHNGKSFDYEQGNHNVVVGIIDTGIDTIHPDLTKNFLGGRNYVPAGDYDGQNPSETNDPNDIRDRIGHGSYVAGAIAGNGEIMGVAPGTGYKVYRVFGEEGSTSTETIAQAIIGATDDHVNVISMSIGGYDVNGQIKWTDSNTGKTYNLGNEVADLKLYKRAVKYAVDHSVTVVAAAGNDNIDAGNKKAVTEFLNKQHEGDGYHFVGASVELPGSLPGVITVSATGPDDIKASYSNYGAGFVDVTAPGGDERRYPNGYWFYDLCYGATNGSPDATIGSYGYWEGTSMATPKVSAVAALIIAHNDSPMSPSQVKENLLHSAEDIGQEGTDDYFGKGMVIAPYQPETLPENVVWEHHFGGMQSDVGNDIIQTSDGGYLSVGGTNSYSTGGDFDGDIFVVKMGKDGRTEWTKTLGGQNGDGETPHVFQTKDGGYFIQSNSGSFSTDGSNEIYLAKLSKDGTLEWQKNIDGKGRNLNPTDITQGKDGGYVIAGKVYSSDEYNFYLTKIDDAGNVVWEKIYGEDNGANDSANAITSTQDGGYIITGTSQINSINSDVAMLKVGSQGNQEWIKTYDVGELDTGNAIKELSDGSYVVVGNRYTKVWHGSAFDKISDIYMARMDKNGDLLWQKTLGQPDLNEEANGLEMTSDGNLILAGAKQRENTIMHHETDLYLMEFNPNGDQLKEQIIKSEQILRAQSIKRLRDGNYIVVGDSTANHAGPADTNMYVLKLSCTLEK